MKKKYKIEGMTCSACQSHVAHAVNKLDGIASCNVNLLANSMEVDFNEQIVNDEKIKAAVDKAGYKALDMEKNNKPNKESKKIIKEKAL